jgi:CRISPR/Cas system-associated exonuclease Cas4 (RecB family)
MYDYCSNIEENIPLPIDRFPRQTSPSICRQCRYQEICFPPGLQNPDRSPEEADKA